MDSTRRRLLAGLAAGTVVGIAGCTGSGNGGDPTTAADTPTPTETQTQTESETQTSTGSVQPSSGDGPVGSVQIPANADSFTYATMGDPDAPEVVYYGNWKCPYCAQFSTGEADGLSLGEIAKEYVSSGDVRLTYRCLAYTSNGPFLGPDAPRAARAGLAVWNVDPDSYWPFHEAIMTNQPPEAKRWATVKKLASFAEEAGVDDVETVRKQIENGKYQSAVRDTTDAADAAGVSGTPTLAADGRTASPFEESQARSLLDSL